MGGDTVTTSTKPDAHKFLKACYQGHLKLMKQMLADDAALIIIKDKQGCSSFTLALLASRREAVTILRTTGYAPDPHEALLAQDRERYALH